MNLDRSVATASSEPFGHPYASEMSKSEIVDGFFEMPNMRFADHAGSYSFCSRRGGGKTHLLRKSYFEKIADHSDQLVQYEGTALSTEYVLPEFRRFIDRKKELAQHLRTLWEIVLSIRMAGIVARAVRSGRGQFSPTETSDFLKRLDEVLEPTGFGLKRATNTAAIYHELVPKLSSVDSHRRFLAKFNRRELIALLGEANLTAYLFLDDTDDDYHDSPSFWDINLCALFRAASVLRRDLRSIHVITAMRREVYDHLQHSDPNWTRIAGSINVRDIVWTEPTLRQLFEKKIDKLPSDHLLFQDAAQSKLEEFLGVASIEHIEVPDTEEPVFDYILRHTFYRARDLIYMGNDLWRQLRQIAKDRSLDPVPLIRKGVSTASSAIAQELAAECDAAIRDEFDLPENEPVTFELVRFLGSNVVSRRRLERAYETAETEYPGLVGSKAYDKMAYWGLLGWTKKDKETGKNVQHFNFESVPNAPRVRGLPVVPQYFVHPALYDHEQVGPSLDIRNDAVVGHGYGAPEESPVGLRPSASGGRELSQPVQLDSEEPILFDRYHTEVRLSEFEHNVLKGLFAVKNITVVTYSEIARIREQVTGEKASSDHKEVAHQFARGLRKKLKAFGVRDRNAVIRNIQDRGYEAGTRWSAKRRIRGGGEASLWFTGTLNPGGAPDSDDPEDPEEP